MIRHTLISLVLCGITAGLIWYGQRSEHKKIAVVDAIRLFNDYKMKQELESRSAPQLASLRQRSDSLQRDLETRSKIPGVPREELALLYRELNTARAGFEQAYQTSNQEINRQVWERLNPLIDAYGKQAHLRLIIGANGMGTVLYNDAYYDHTQALTNYINRKYEEGH